MEFEHTVRFKAVLDIKEFGGERREEEMWLSEREIEA